MARAKFDSTLPVTTVGGVEVRIFTTEALGKHPIVGQIVGAGRTAHEQWTTTGAPASGAVFNQLKNGEPDPAQVYKPRQPRAPKAVATEPPPPPPPPPAS